MKQPQCNIRFTPGLPMASLAAMLTFLKMAGSITASPGLGIPFITSFTVPET